MGIRTFAAIDVGSYELTIKIFEFSGKHNMREIDCVSKRLDLGSDTYAMGKIGNEKMDELCRTLKDFSDIMKAYKVEDYKAYATSAIRETENTTIVQDRIAQRTGINVEILSNSEQRFMDYKSVASKGEGFRKVIEEKTAILDIGGGSIQLSLFDNDTLVSTQNVRLGVLRIQDYLNRFSAKSTQIEELIYEMAMARLDTYEKLYLKDREIQTLIVVDDYLSPWAVRKRGGDSGKAVLEEKDFDVLYEKLRDRNLAQAASDMDLPEERIPLVFISAVLIKCIAKLMGVRRIWAPGVTLCDGIAYEYAEKNKMFRGEQKALGGVGQHCHDHLRQHQESARAGQAGAALSAPGCHPPRLREVYQPGEYRGDLLPDHHGHGDHRPVPSGAGNRGQCSPVQPQQVHLRFTANRQPGAGGFPGGGEADGHPAPGQLPGQEP